MTLIDSIATVVSLLIVGRHFLNAMPSSPKTSDGIVFGSLHEMGLPFFILQRIGRPHEREVCTNPEDRLDAQITHEWFRASGRYSMTFFINNFVRSACT